MAITTLNPTYVNSGNLPLAGQILASGGADQVELAYKCTWTITLDGAATTAALNIIDGTQTLPFTPSGILLNASGGTQQAAAALSVIVRSITNTVVNVTLSGAGTSANTLVITGFILR